MGTGVYLVATGSASLGLKVYDLDGGSVYYAKTDASLYDPFTGIAA